MTSLINLPGQLMWHLPMRFKIAKSLGRGYSFRCVLFHDVSDHTSPLSDGLGVTISVRRFEECIRFLAKHYTPVTLGEILTGSERTKDSARAVLVTFDDSYASLAVHAAPILKHYGVPAVMFINGLGVGNQGMTLDNVVCYAVNTSGMDAVLSVAQAIKNDGNAQRHSLENVLINLLPSLSQEALNEFRDRLISTCGINVSEVLDREEPYLSENQLRSLASDGFEIGNHTYSHACCRALGSGDFEREIYYNKARLEAITGTRVRAFSVPYGYARDLTDELCTHLHLSGHEAAFLVESRSNTTRTDLYHINRVSIHADSDAALFGEIEILPRLRAIRDRLAS